MLDPHAMLRALGVQSVEAAVPVQGGTDTAIWRVEHGGVASALRVFRPEQVAVFERECAAMALAARHGIPAPAVRAHGFWQDRPLLLLAWCAGEPLAVALRREPARLLRHGRAFGRAQAAIHRIAVDHLPDDAPGDWVTWYDAADDALAAYLRRVVRTEQRLLHLDYHPMNVMVEGGAVSGVLDWANARVGDPRADVARTATILVVEPHHAHGDPRWYRLVRRLFAWGWLRGYQEAAGPLGDMAPFYAWAGAVMAADLAPRVADPSSWWQPCHLAAVRRWGEQWRARAGG